MFDALKQMQKDGIFKLQPNDGLDATIAEATNYAAIDPLYDSIQSYLKFLSHDLAYRHNVDISKTISDFGDKFTYEMFDMSITCNDYSNNIYQKEILYGKAKSFSFGIDVHNATFTLAEMKLLKLINHYYISLSSKAGFNDNYVYIPISSLRLIFPHINNVKLKEQIVITCEKLNTKKVYWSFKNSYYADKLKKSQLVDGDRERIANISILYLPKKNRNGIDGESVEIKGIICRIVNFMKLRYTLKQIYNYFPIESLRLNYLGYTVASKLDYYLNLKLKGNKHNLVYNKKLSDLTNEIYVYNNSKIGGYTYFYQIVNQANSKESICKLLKAILLCLTNLQCVRQFSAYFVMRNKEIDLHKYIVASKELTNKEDISAQVVKLYNEIYTKSNLAFDKARLAYLIRTGDLLLKLKF